jgi:hypothetical protein
MILILNMIRGLEKKEVFEKKKILNHKKAQLTLFVIIAILIAALIIIYFFWIEPKYISGRTEKVNFDSCVRDSISQEISTLSLTGGVVNSSFYYSYQDHQLPYYCYTNIPYQTCVVQRPMIKQFFEEQLIKNLKKRINTCYKESIEELTDLGYEVKTGEVELNLSIIPSYINIDLRAPTTVEGRRFTDYQIGIKSNIYDILMVATSIVQYESGYGDAPISEFMYYYPNLIIDKFKRGESTTVYIIHDKSSDLKFQFASRSLIWPAGYKVVESEGYEE